MTYQVLARKWRPRSFETLVGQEHVVKALTHALSTGRLHHAYLFTGTRGVGKTTIARILAKALNCEKNGISATPCGECAACTEIDNGRYVDYIEMDAASYRGVDEMVDLLERAAYAPSSGRYKVYMIDEVHQLSNHAFNAMLKTLEEPPAHILFILATTDPQKVPVTVLSRCLQFNLKQLPVAEIAGQLGRILEAEGIAGEPGGLRLIANGARGSMRDALSLMDQAIAYSGGKVSEEAVRAMLGTIDDSFLYALLEALAAGDGNALLEVARSMDERNISFDGALQELGALLHLVALAHTAPDAIPAGADTVRVKKLSEALGAEDVQLYYQIAIHARRDLPLAPDEYAGFSMALLRMLAFRPDAPGETKQGPAASRAASAKSEARPAVRQSAAEQPRMDMRAAQQGDRPAPIRNEQPAPGRGDQPAQSRSTQSTPTQGAQSTPARSTQVTPARSAEVTPARSAAAVPFDGDWPALSRTLKVSGVARQLAQQSELRGFDGSIMDLVVPAAARHLVEKPYPDKLQAALAEHFGAPIRLNVSLGETAGGSAQAQAASAIDQDEFVQELLDKCDGTIVDASIQPISTPAQRSKA